MPELTVSMPAFNSERFIGRAVESVLRQEGVDFEIVVVDDGSRDGTADAVRAFRDPRVKLIRNEENRGIARCHNMVVERSRSPFIAHVDSDDLILSGALRKMVEILKSDPRLGQAHCHFFEIDEAGRTTEAEFRERRDRFLSGRVPGMDYREKLFRGCVINHLRTYRRDALAEIGPFNEKLRYDVDYEMALRIVDRYEIGLVPEFLYCFRIHGSNTTESLRLKSLRFLSVRLKAWRQVWRGAPGHFIRRRKWAMLRYVLVRTAQIFGVWRIVAYLGRKRRPPAGVDRADSSLDLPPELRPVGETGLFEVVFGGDRNGGAIGGG